MHPTNDDDNLTTNSGPWALEVESMKKKKKQTETPDLSNRRILKGKRRIGSVIGAIDSKSPSTSANTPCTINKNVSVGSSFMIRNPSLINKNTVLQKTIITNHDDSHISENNYETIQKRTRRNTYELQDTINDLEILVKESPAKKIDVENVRQKKKKKSKSLETNLQKNSKELKDEEINRSTPVLYTNDDVDILQNKKKRNRSKKNSPMEIKDDDIIEPQWNHLNTITKSEEELLSNESMPVCFRNETKIIESPIINQKVDYKKHKGEKLQANCKNKRYTYELEDSTEMLKKREKRNTYELQESVNNIDIIVNNSTVDNSTENVNTLTDSFVTKSMNTPRKRWKIRESLIMSTDGKYQKGSTPRIDSPLNKVNDETLEKRNTFEIETNTRNKKSQKRRTFEIDTENLESSSEKSQKPSPAMIELNTGNSKTQKRSTFEIQSSNRTSQKRETFEVDSNNSIVSAMKRKSNEFDPDDSLSRECLIKKGRSSETKPGDSATKRIRRRGIYNAQKVSTSSDEELKSSSLSVNKSSCEVLQLSSPWKGQISFNKEIDSQKVIEKPKFLTPNPLEKKSITRTSSQVKKSANKMPNYSLIHKKAFDRMESLEDHLERKKARANALLSGSKVKIGITSKTKINTPNSKKQLFLNKGNTPSKIINSEKKVSPTKSLKHFRTPIKMMRTDKTPMKSKPEKENKSPMNQKNSTNRYKSEISEWLSSEEAKLPLSPLKTQFGNTTGINNVPVRKNVSVKFQTPPITPVKYSMNKSRVQTPMVFKTNVIKPQKKVIPSKSNIPVINKPFIPEPLGITRFGFKANQDLKIGGDLKLQAVKAVATKTRAKKNTVDDRRNYIKGVRSNRRFDLLMNMRKQMQ